MVRFILCLLFLFFIFKGDPDIFDYVHSAAMEEVKKQVLKN